MEQQAPAAQVCALLMWGNSDHKLHTHRGLKSGNGGREGEREGVGGLAGEGIYLHTEVCTLQVTVLLSCLAYSAFKTMHSRLSYVSELDFTP